MLTTDQARAFIAAHGTYLSEVGDEHGGWTVIARTYTTFKHSQVHFTITVADPDEQLWQYLIGESTYDGTEITGDPYPVSAVTETKTVVSFAPRLIARTSQENA